MLQRQPDSGGDPRIIQCPMQAAVNGNVPQEVAGNGFQLVVGEMGQTLAGQADRAVPGVGEQPVEEGEFVANES